MRTPRPERYQERVNTVQRHALRGLALRLLPAHRGRRRGRRDRVPLSPNVEKRPLPNV
jgi:hypothetical protein